MSNRTAFGRERNPNSPCDEMKCSNGIYRNIVFVVAIAIALSNCKQKAHHGIEIEISGSTIKLDTSLYVCATISNGTDSNIYIYPPTIGGYQPFTQYGIISKSDTNWFIAATDLDVDTYPSIKISPNHQYSFEIGPGYYELWNRGTNANQTKAYANILNSATAASIRYETNPMKILKPNSDPLDSAIFKTYTRQHLESKFHRISKGKTECDTGLKAATN